MTISGIEVLQNAGLQDAFIQRETRRRLAGVEDCVTRASAGAARSGYLASIYTGEGGSVIRFIEDGEPDPITPCFGRRLERPWPPDANDGDVIMVSVTYAAPGFHHF